MLLTPDHLAISAASLDAGVAYVEALFGVEMAPGGTHPVMGTHNRLLSLGPDFYLEVIAIDAGAPKPSHARWFGLDQFSGPPRLTNWIARCYNMAAALKRLPPELGQPVALTRGDFRWKMAVPASGELPYNGMFPALIEWQGNAHPALLLPDHGFRLAELQIVHPRADQLRDQLGAVMDLNRVHIEQGEVAGISARIHTPLGMRELA